MVPKYQIEPLLFETLGLAAEKPDPKMACFLVFVLPKFTQKKTFYLIRHYLFFFYIKHLK